MTNRRKTPRQRFLSFPTAASWVLFRGRESEARRMKLREDLKTGRKAVTPVTPGTMASARDHNADVRGGVSTAIRRCDGNT